MFPVELSRVFMKLSDIMSWFFCLLTAEHSPLKNCTWGHSSWLFPWDPCWKQIPKASQNSLQTRTLNKYYHFVPHSVLSVSTILEFPYMWFLSGFLKYSHLCQLALPGIKWRWAPCCYVHYLTQLWSPTFALTRCFVPNNHRQICPGCHLKSNHCVKHKFIHINFNLFQGILIKQCTGDKH